MAKDRMILVIGDKNYSSWSLRPWLVLKASGLRFREHLVPLDTPRTKKQIKQFSAAGKVPVLLHNSRTIWDSLAICEYVAEIAYNRPLWPEDRKTRSLARSYVCEMHSGFASLRSQLSMDVRLRTKIGHLLPSTISDISRILEIWNECLKSSPGPYLFGDFGIVDAFYAPVVLRFQSYGIDISSKPVRKYMNRILHTSSVREWTAAAKKEKNAGQRF